SGPGRSSCRPPSTSRLWSRRESSSGSPRPRWRGLARASRWRGCPGSRSGTRVLCRKPGSFGTSLRPLSVGGCATWCPMPTWPSKMSFTKLDAWLRYARWKQYVEQGLTDQEAANHVWIDLVRYGTRSDLVDFWKSIPLNFFVPWRVGTITSFIKDAKTAPAYT